MKDLSNIKSKYTLPAMIEVLLFVAVMPISISQLATSLHESAKSIKMALDELDDSYQKTRGLRLQYKGKSVQLVTSPELSIMIEEFLGIETTTTLTQASLETM